MNCLPDTADGGELFLKGVKMIKLIDIDKVRDALSKVVFPDAAMHEQIISIITGATANVDMSERMVSLCEGEKIQTLDNVISWPTIHVTDDKNKSDFEQISKYWAEDYYDRSSTVPVFRKVENFF